MTSYMDTLDTLIDLTKKKDARENDIASEATALIKLVQNQLMTGKVDSFSYTRIVCDDFSPNIEYEDTYYWNGSVITNSFDNQDQKPLLNCDKRTRILFCSHINDFLQAGIADVKHRQLEIEKFERLFTVEDDVECESPDEYYDDSMMMDGVEE